MRGSAKAVSVMSKTASAPPCVKKAPVCSARVRSKSCTVT